MHTTSIRLILSVPTKSTTLATISGFKAPTTKRTPQRNPQVERVYNHGKGSHQVDFKESLRKALDSSVAVIVPHVRQAVGYFVISERLSLSLNAFQDMQ